MMTSKMLKFTSSWKTQKAKYLENESQFFPLVKKFVNCTFRAILAMAKNNFFSGGNL